MKLVNKSLNLIRFKLGFKGLKNRYLLLKNNEGLTQEEQQELKPLLKLSPGLAIAYELKEELREIYETTTTVKMGIRKLKKWLIYARVIFGQTAETLSNNLTDICWENLNRLKKRLDRLQGINLEHKEGSHLSDKKS